MIRPRLWRKLPPRCAILVALCRHSALRVLVPKLVSLNTCAQLWPSMLRDAGGQECAYVNMTREDQSKTEYIVSWCD